MQTLPPELLTQIAAGPREWLRLAHTCREIAAKLDSTITIVTIRHLKFRALTAGTSEYFGRRGQIYVSTVPEPDQGNGHIDFEQNSLTVRTVSDYEDLIMYYKDIDEIEDYTWTIKSPSAVYLAIIFRLPVRILSLTPTMKLSSARAYSTRMERAHIRSVFTPADAIIGCLIPATFRHIAAGEIVSFDGNIVGKVVYYLYRTIIEFTDGEEFGVGGETIITARGPIRCTVRTEELLRRLPQLRGWVFMWTEVLACGNG